MPKNVKILDTIAEYRLAKEFWQNKLAGEVITPNLPHDYLNHANYAKGQDEFAVNPEVAERLLTITRSQDLLVYITLLSTLLVEVRKYTGERDISLGIPVFYQTEPKEDEQFNQHLLYRTDVDTQLSFKQLMGKVKNELLECYSNQHYPLAQVLEAVNIERTVSELLPISIALENFHTSADIKSLTESPKNELTLTFSRQGDRILGSAYYNKNLLKEATVKRFINHYLNVLQNSLNHPDTPLTAIEMMDEGERSEILTRFNQTEAPSLEITLPDLFAEQVKKSPEKCAVSLGAEALSYRELNLKANQLASELKHRGVKANTIVGVMLPRSFEMIIGIMAILKAGGAYLPISPDYPEERIKFMLQDSGAKLLLTDARFLPKVSFSGEILNLQDESLYQGEGENLSGVVSPADLAYVIYTSGTTGQPKGVMIEHQAVVNRINWMQKMYPLSSKDIILQKTTYTFDVSVWELFWWFFCGASLCLLPPGGEKDPAVIVQTAAEKRVTVMHFVPSMLNLFLAHLEGLTNLTVLASLKWVFTSGEALAVTQVARFNSTLKRTNGTGLVNLYGPTEAAVDVSYYNCAETDNIPTVPIGKPIDNIKLYIVAENHALAPIGVPGELCISGVGLARGYLNRPELTEEKFIPNPFSGTRDKFTQRMYRTGDKARWLADGNIEFLGRIDSQVKIRGFRIELGEIEHALNQIPGVAASVVIDRKDAKEERYLCAYLVAEREFTIGELKRHLLQNLPEYMIPDYFVQLEEIPLTSNGKVNRKALPEPDGSITTGVEYVAASTPTEEVLTQLWAELLKIERIGVHDNFFELGGHSLKGAVLATKVQAALGVELPLGELFRHPTIASLAAYIEQAEKQAIITIPPAGKREHYPAWPGQERLFTLQEINPDGIVYNMSSVIIIEGKLDVQKLEQAFQKVIHRHELLRTYFEPYQERVIMRVLEEVEFVLQFGELNSQAELKNAVEEFIQPFNLRQAPLLRAKLWKISAEEHVLMYDMHHIITDGVGGVALIKNLAAFYAETDLPPLKVQYKDFAVWQEEILTSGVLQKQEDYLLSIFSGELPILNLPTDYPRPAMRSTAGNNVYLNLDRELADKLRDLAFQTDSTLYMVSLAAFYLLLSKYSGQEDLIVGSPAAGRRHADLDEVIGLFINNIVMRNYPVGNKCFTDFLSEVKENALGAFANQDYQFDQLIAKLNLPKDMSRNPLFDVFFAFQNYDFAAVEVAGIKLSQYQYGRKIAKFDLLLFTYDTPDEISLDLEYNTALFKPESVERMLQHYVNILTQIVANPQLTLSAIDMLTVAEKKQVLFDFNNTVVEYRTDATIQVLFEEQVQRTPENIAVSFKEQNLTYAELNQKANRLARKLRHFGVERNTVVGIMLDKSCELAVSLLAILKAGGAYLPIDPDYPEERILYMLEDSKAKLIITSKVSRGEIPFTLLQGLESSDVEIVTTPLRSHIQEFDRLPMPDRTLIDLSKYRGQIGMASVTNCMPLQTTRGCPYHCLFCHKVWSKSHVFRSAENIYQEVEYYYKQGVTHFEILDDCFNLNIENSRRFFQLVIKNGLKVQIFFPNGLRGDLLTPEYIDLMVEAGVVNINLSLETASPRLQRLVKKNLDLDKFRRVMEYIATRHPQVILELATMHGFPTETEEEAMQTLNFIKDIKWIHFPYIHILKIYPNTEMEELALQHGVTKEDIMKSVNLAYHEIPETLPFSKSFTRKYQAEFLKEYFLNPERLQAVLPVEMRLLSEEALVQKYNAYLPAEIGRLEDVIELAGIRDFDLSEYRQREAANGGESYHSSIYDTVPRKPATAGNGKRILLLDLSQHFSSASMLYKVTEQPLGLLYLLTYLKQELGDAVDGRIYKSGVDFDSFAELQKLVEDYQPELIGIRTLSLYKEFFHETVALLKVWAENAVIVTGGPYSTSDYQYILKDAHVDLAVIGEGEYTFTALVKAMLADGFKLPPKEVLNEIEGIAYAGPGQSAGEHGREVLYIEEIANLTANEAAENLNLPVTPRDLAYVMYTSGSTGKPKGVMVEHRQVNNCINWMQDEFKLQAKAVILQRTNLTFDPSVWEIFWPLYIGGRVELLTIAEGKDAQYLIKLMQERTDLTMLYCPASMVSAMNYLLDSDQAEKSSLHMPYFLIGAEPISREVANNFYKYLDGIMVNTYGPTECTINNTYYYLQPNDSLPIVPIGKPVANNQIYILSKDLNPMPVNMVGEIYIGGASVARGYCNNPEQTEARFGANPFGAGKLYRTGDLGRWLNDGNIEILGRTDYQVKIRGYRIELGEIENALLKHKSITECAVIVRDTKAEKEEIKFCEHCGISTAYPQIELTVEGVCTTCAELPDIEEAVQAYFKTPEDLEQLIRGANQHHAHDYDCLLLYAGGLASGYALYQLVERGYRVLTATYDHGYYSKSELQNIKKLTSKLGVDHVFFTHEKSAEILKESLKNAATVCKGCFFASSSLAAEYAQKHNIKVVIGATLSRGQIIENKVYDLVKRGIFDVQDMEKELASIQKMNPALNYQIFDVIGIEGVNSGTIYDEVKLVDFYRYFNVTNAEMLAALYQRDEYWQSKKAYAIYSTKCPIKEIGDYCHQEERGYHYYGSATAWEYRLGHLTRQNVQEDLTIHVKQQSYENFLKILGLTMEKPLKELESKYICAYLVAEAEQSIADLRDYLVKHVPDYMLPSYFVYLDKMPLTQEGKINRRALPIPTGDMYSGAEYVAPRNEIEEVLAKVWQEVLGVSQVGIEDNFFDFGGDSIRAIRVISAVQKYGYKFEVRDLFTNPKIKDLSAKVSRKRNEIEQAPVIGEVPLLPIQQWFFAQNFTEQHHWNQSVMLYKREGFNPEVIGKTFTHIIQHHDSLRAIFMQNDTTVRQWCRDLTDELFTLEVFDYRGKALDALAVEKQCEKIQHSINLAVGPLVKLGLFKTDAGDHLLIAIHHLVIDGISWRILFEDFAIGYEQGSQGKEITFQEKSNSYRDWARFLAEYAKSSELLKEAAYWQQVEATPVKPLPKDRLAEKAEKTLKNASTVSITLSPTHTRELLTNVHKAYNTEINDILLTVLSLAISQWTGEEKMLIQLEGHGREQLTGELDISRTVGWFTSQYPLILNIMNALDISYQLKSTKEALRRIPNKGLGYGVLKYLTTGVIETKLQPEINFNYLGQFDQDIKEEIFEFSRLAHGNSSSPNAENPYTLDINGMVSEGKLRLVFTYNPAEYDAKTIQQIGELYHQHLVNLIEHCLRKDGTEFTPTDYGNSSISLEELQVLEDSLQEVFETTALAAEEKAQEDEDIFGDF